MKWELTLHSAVSVITNSSTVIYTEVTEETITLFQKAMNSIFQAFGISQKVEDLFEFEIGHTEWQRKAGRIRMIRWEKKLWYQYSNDATNEICSTYNEYEKNKPDWWDDEYKICQNDPKVLTIIAKTEDPRILEAAQTFMKMFDSVKGESYDTN